MPECDHNCNECNKDCEARDLTFKTNPINKFKKVIGVISAKGGVGKSFVTSLLALKKLKEGNKVGILDADVTGPSIPKGFGVKGPMYGDNNLLIPLKSKDGIFMVSSSLLLDNNKEPILWRGSLLISLIRQFYVDTSWGNLDYLFIDMPPGTSDVALTVFQSIKLDGIIIVTTPQDLVSEIVAKTINMANKMNVNILGIVENMSFINCPHCNEVIYPFGMGTIEKLVNEFNLKVIAKFPINPNFSSLIDKGEVAKIDIDKLKIDF